MELYPADYVDRNVPYYVFSGLGNSNDGCLEIESVNLDQNPTSATVLNSTLPPVTGDVARLLTDTFKSISSAPEALNTASIAKDSRSLMSSRMSFVGRVFEFPPRKAKYPPLEESRLYKQRDDSKLPTRTLHSTLSPRSAGSLLHPDGIMTPKWVARHQSTVPAVFVAFCPFSLAHAHGDLSDDRLESEILTMKQAVELSGFKTRFAIVLVTDGTVHRTSQHDNRLTGIRKACGLDVRTSFFVLSTAATAAEISSFAVSLVSSLHTVAIDYYRDLSKHIRRKRSKGPSPSPSASLLIVSSQALTTSGWQIRYDFKLGVLAEFRQEMESALRYYYTALELLFRDFLSTADSSAPLRWYEHRLLADALAIRVISCHLWIASTTLAVQSWSIHRNRMSKLIDYKNGVIANGSSSQIWGANWAKVMAQLIQRADLPTFRSSPDTIEMESLGEAAYRVWASVEKAATDIEALPTWFRLHHEGYWYLRSARETRSRRGTAQELTACNEAFSRAEIATAEVVRSLLESSQSSESHQQSVYMKLLKASVSAASTKDSRQRLVLATNAFSTRQQVRTKQWLQYETGLDHLRQGECEEAYQVLRSLRQDMFWRREGWWLLLDNLTRLLRQCAKDLGITEIQAITHFDSCRKGMIDETGHNHRSSSSHDSSVLEPASQRFASSTAPFTPIVMELEESEVKEYIDCKIVFQDAQTYAGETTLFQLSIHWTADASSAPLQLSGVSCMFDRYIHGLQIKNSWRFDHEHGSREPQDTPCRLIRWDKRREIHSEATRPVVFETSDELLLCPGQTLVLHVPLTFRESGELTVERLQLDLSSTDLSPRIIFTDMSVVQSNIWWQQGLRGLRPKRVVRHEASSIRVLPRLPRMRIRLIDPDRKFHADENVWLQYELANDEEDEAHYSLGIHLTSDFPVHLPTPTWQTSADTMASADLDHESKGTLQPGCKTALSLNLEAPAFACTIQIEATLSYYLTSESRTVLVKKLTFALSLASAFEANYEFTRRIHPDPWPLFFGAARISGNDAITSGICQRWHLSARLASFADETLALESVSLDLLSSSNDTKVAVSDDVAGRGEQGSRAKEESIAIPVPVAPHEFSEWGFLIDVSRASFEDCAQVLLDLSLCVRWRRASTTSIGSSLNTTRLAIPIQVIPALEPQILFTVTPSILDFVPRLVHLDYTLENPTLHFLSFDFAMDATEDIAFSGPKLSSINLPPFSRTVVRYCVLPLLKEKWVPPNLRVLDRYFGKYLQVSRIEESSRSSKTRPLSIDYRST